MAVVEDGPYFNEIIRSNCSATKIIISVTRLPFELYLINSKLSDQNRDINFWSGSTITDNDGTYIIATDASKNVFKNKLAKTHYPFIINNIDHIKVMSLTKIFKQLRQVEFNPNVIIFKRLITYDEVDIIDGAIFDNHDYPVATVSNETDGLQLYYGINNATRYVRYNDIINNENCDLDEAKAYIPCVFFINLDALYDKLEAKNGLLEINGAQIVVPNLE